MSGRIAIIQLALGLALAAIPITAALTLVCTPLWWLGEQTLGLDLMADGRPRLPCFLVLHLAFLLLVGAFWWWLERSAQRRQP